MKLETVMNLTSLSLSLSLWAIFVLARDNYLTKQDKYTFSIMSSLLTDKLFDKLLTH